jgi:pimeloyl-ACP methyl ester carboxylesterase
MKRTIPLLLLLGLSLALSGCGTCRRSSAELRLARELTASYPDRWGTLARETEDRILALNPDHVTAEDLREVLGHAPAPRLINIRGGIFPVYLCMESFSDFVIGMGYPAVSVTNPATGNYSFSCYDNARCIAGAIAWYYEKEGLRPVIVGHSQGGMQAVKVLYQFGERGAKPLPVWNPLTAKEEPRTTITDPLTGTAMPATSLRVPYVSSVGAGGFTRFMPNQWDMVGRLRKIPDSVEDFVGYSVPFDLFGGDLLGFGPMNLYEAKGSAQVRNLRLPLGDNHVIVPVTEHLLKRPEVVAWINDYVPSEPPPKEPKFKGDTRHLLWAADVWYSLKRHWVLELQRSIRARRAH